MTGIIPVDVAVEDELSELIVLKLLATSATSGRSYHVGTTCRRGGFGYLRGTIKGWNAAAAGKPFVVLTDLDLSPCPSHLIQEWLTSKQNPTLIFRIAVKEVEAWLLADVSNLSDYLRVASRLIPKRLDEISDPKDSIIDLARQSRLKSVRDSLVPRPGTPQSKASDIMNASALSSAVHGMCGSLPRTRPPSQARYDVLTNSVRCGLPVRPKPFSLIAYRLPQQFRLRSDKSPRNPYVPFEHALKIFPRLLNLSVIQMPIPNAVTHRVKR